MSCKTGDVGERQIRQAPVERILRNSRDSQRARNVVVEGVQILGARAAAVEVGANNVGQLADAARVGNRNVKAADRSIAAYAWERIRQVGARPVVVKAEGQIVARGVAASAAASARGRCAEGVVQTYVQIVAVAVGGSYEVEVLEIARQVRQSEYIAAIPAPPELICGIWLLG